ncbi:BamA/TamA family outer membrane protein [Siphonobacter aquaeclarae]|uniref:Calcineurin-like phosphoesterase n=1 Tax=Siphonobacter aquaeclarae TaxID=563176 RepID=A0A1G9YJ94_9BACT|nr:BamA/TamA family outer membrane protein [Siphonobacter aquaeclarae]SDN08992.1 Calcineurin-like phosphoesterase [Siphonobacter aquaeclarae]
MTKRLLLLVFWFLGWTAALAQQAPRYSVFLLGDAGNPVPGHDPVLSTLQKQLTTAGPNALMAFLGDNLYPSGLPAPGPGRAPLEQKLKDQLAIIRDFKGKTLVIPGNHDWQQGHKDGWNRVRNQADYIRQLTGRDDVFVPEGGCPGPVEIPVSPELTILAFDSQYWLHPWDKPDETSDCGTTDIASFFIAVEDILERNQHRQVLVLGHHPMYSHGDHGGYYTWKDHLFPLTEKVPWLYVPLPVIGSIYPLYRTLIGNIQDIPHPKYQLFRNGMVRLLRQYGNVFYANGHDHNLQLIERDSLYYLTSGSGSKQTPVKKARDSRFAESTKGFARLDYGADSLTIRFYAPDSAFSEGRILYSQVIPLPRLRPVNNVPTTTKLPEIQAASLHYGAGFRKRMWLGSNYRDVWATPIRTRTVDLPTERGGLKILQKGGGMQTLSLRLEAKSGMQYVMRSVEKYAENAIPLSLRSGFVADLVQDQISASHPYAALAIPPLAGAAGVLHTNPEVVRLPADTTLGPYRRQFAGQMVLYEERGDDGFSGFKKVISTDKVLQKLAEDNDNQVNQQEVLRARLFDMWLGDWDRHDDQWRWAVEKTKKTQSYIPIPRDRDQAFFVNEGILPKIVSRKWIMPKFQGFGFTIRDVPGFNFNARYFDRSFLTEPGKADWLRMADSLRHRLTDERIAEAMSRFPVSADGSGAIKQSAETIASKLRQRREDLTRYAEQQYLFLAKAVDVVGSDKEELFLVNRLPDGKTEVRMTKKGGKELYSRVFDPTETNEVRLYGLGGNDVFRVGGSAVRGPVIRIIGGTGMDDIRDSSHVNGLRRKTVVYDTKDSTRLEGGHETRSELSDHASVNLYNRKSFLYDLIQPLVSVQFNPDDGVFLGGGVLIRKQGFRKNPFAAQHRITVNHSFATKAYNFDYQGDFTHLIGSLDLQVNAEIRSPNFVRNFFGLGNETVFDRDKKIRYYRTRFEEWHLDALLRKRVGSHLTLFAGPVVEQIELEENKNRYINQYLETVGPVEADRLLKTKWYGGLKAGLTFDNRDSKLYPTRGIYLNTNYLVYKGLRESTKNLNRLEGELAFYWSARLPARLTLATRLGGGKNFDDYEFFQSNTLGGLSNLRGFRRTRFAGKSSLYHNLEARLKIATLRTYFFPAYLGVLAFHDIGRVWQPGENSNQWHRGVGGGIWFAPYQAAVISLVYAHSREENIPMIRLGFLF